MLFILTGDIQIGKTRWLQKLTSDLIARGVMCAGVLAPGIWVPSETGDENGFEKLGIDNLLLPQGTSVSFARRLDLAQAEGTFDPQSQAGQAQLGWAISDEAIAQVNAHFDELVKGEVLKTGQKPGFLVVDELGRLELLRNEGLTSALALLDEGPTDAFPHALIVVRDTLCDAAVDRFEAIWGTPRIIKPNGEASYKIFATFNIV